MKNVIKAVKKLKLWSKKKRKKTHEYPPHYCCSCCSSTTHTQPSAPPLPSSSSWLEVEYNYGTFLPPPEPEIAQPQGIAIDSSPASRTPNSSYQQYMVSVSEPVYGIPVPVIHTTRREGSTGQFGCVFSFGSYLFRCLFPCFHIREAV
ncbi:hypothetical protein E2542_SST00154 [Spatholobus suberectus]|nr:hypothetical protein E2542_SST00154 [Spatholobus suberectus]